LDLISTVFDVSSMKIKKTIKSLSKLRLDPFLKDILLTLLFLDYWKAKYFEEHGMLNYIKKV